MTEERECEQYVAYCSAEYTRAGVKVVFHKAESGYQRDLPLQVGLPECLVSLSCLKRPPIRSLILNGAFVNGQTRTNPANRETLSSPVLRL